jgi:hypothetical protein
MNSKTQTKGESKMKRETINLIPDDYDGCPRNAAGYFWNELVLKDDGTVDNDKSVPSTDLYGISLDECFQNLQKKFGNIAIRNDNNYGFVKKIGSTLDKKEVSVAKAISVAVVNCMWCGGGTFSVFIDWNEIVAHKKSDCKETELSNSFGYCEKCETYCFGDCEAN